LLAGAGFMLGGLAVFVLPFWSFVPLRSDTILVVGIISCFYRL
jgi:hypothetical protein